MRLLILTTAMVCLATAILRADEHFVSLSGTNDTTGGYTNWAGAATQIQWAVDAAGVGEKVWVSNGTYCVTNQIAVANQITIQSVHGYSNTTVYADWPTYTNSCFFVSNAIVDGFTITNGHNYISSGGGATIINNGIMRNCYFTKNVSSYEGYYAGGGGAYVGSGCIMSNCWFIANQSAYSGASQNGRGGGVRMDEGQLFNCAVISNTSVFQGAGVYAAGAACIISNCNISFNTTGLPGGGVFLSSGTIIDCVISNNQSIGGNYNNGGGMSGVGNIINCIIVNNNTTDGTAMSTHDGGGLNLGSPSYVSNCIIANNKSQDHGGGLSIGGGAGDIQVVACRIYNNICLYGDGGGVKMSSGGQIRNSLIYNNTNASATSFGGGGVSLTNAATITNNLYGLINCTIANNYSATEGGGVAAGGPSNYVANCIIASNTSSLNNFPDVYNIGENSNNYWYSCANPNAPLAPNQGNITNNPMFVDTSTTNYHLSANSPCINRGINQSWMTNSVDLEGYRRIDRLSGIVDMGAYEFIHKITLFSGH